MKALTNILSHLLMLLMLFIVACTEETAEVDNLMRQEQYVTVRMNIPGMTATATRAADGVIESITALAFDDADKLLEIETITTVTNTNTNNGFKGTFNLTVPNGTTTIHFLANLPDDYNLTNDYNLTDVKKESDLTKLSIGDWQTLRYWGMATYDGSNSTLSTTLYRNLAKISIKPSETDPEFNQFTQDQLKMTGFYMPNERGALIPNNNGAFDFDMNSNYCTIPQDVSSANYQLWDFTSMYAFEHENTDSNPTYIICKIGDYHYKVALADNEGNRYPIIRNHEYIIYVSDVDDYSHDDNYRADTYDKAFDKLPINLDVQQEVIETVELGISAATASLYYDSDNTEQITVTVLGGKTLSQLTITPSVDCFTIIPTTDLSGPVDGVYTYAPEGGVTGSVTFTIAPKSGYNFTNVSSSTLTFGGTGVDMNVSTAQTTVTLTAKPAEVTDLVVTPVGSTTIDLGEGGNKKVKLTLSLPSISGQIEILTNYMFKVTRIDEGMTQPQLINGNYYYYDNIGATTINLELELSDTHYLSTEGDCSITFNYNYNYNANDSKESVTKTIKVVNSELEDGVIWKGEATVNWDPGLYISGATLKDYVEQTIAIDVKTAETGDTQIQCKVGQNSIYQSALDKGVSTTLNISISGDEDVLITGAGVTLLKIYIPETTE